MEVKRADRNHSHLRKTAVTIALGATATFVVSCALAKNWDNISGLLAEVSKHQDALLKVVSESASTKSEPPKLTGEKMTASALGALVSCSNRTINKKIVEAGLATKQGSNYFLTEFGRQFGERTYKITKDDHPFTNIEWDKAILGIIFTPDELAERFAEKAHQDALMSS